LLGGRNMAVDLGGGGRGLDQTTRLGGKPIRNEMMSLKKDKKFFNIVKKQMWNRRQFQNNFSVNFGQIYIIFVI